MPLETRAKFCSEQGFGGREPFCCSSPAGSQYSSTRPRRTLLGAVRISVTIMVIPDAASNDQRFVKFFQREMGYVGTALEMSLM